ncbi:hypothetical protein [Prevotella denticola]|uniref:hypothetical protein n=1 Tax=Prevotella denticola TaxID=28129 RepID=UPI000E5939DB|nr:hypothetical protein [Prevotella denticola]AXV49556.1 hypothetical protein DYJ25_07350 [Prevotella denticola]
MSLIDRLHGHVQEGGLTQRDYKYRCVQTITTKLDEIPVSTIVSKKDYSVERFTDAEGTQGFAFSVKDDIPSVFPEQSQEALVLTNELENIKTKAIVWIDSNTGMITKLLNHEEIIALWEDKKQHLTSKYKFLKGTAGSNALNNLIKMEDKIIYEYDNLMASLSIIPFYSIFFGPHLVTNELQPGHSTIPYASKLFPGNNFSLKLEREIQKQDDGLLLVNYKAKNDKESHFSEAIRKAYDQKIKPVIQYGFTEYEIEVKQQSSIDPAEHCLAKGNLNIEEEVTDNVTLSVDLQVRKLKNKI